VITSQSRRWRKGQYKILFCMDALRRIPDDRVEPVQSAKPRWMKSGLHRFKQRTASCHTRAGRAATRRAKYCPLGSSKRARTEVVTLKMPPTGLLRLRAAVPIPCTIETRRLRRSLNNRLNALSVYLCRCEGIVQPPLRQIGHLESHSTATCAPL
jgi:hypothetical protein